MLLMKKEFFASIRDGAKTTTLRYWKRPQVRAGSIHTVRGLGRVRIESVGQVDLSLLRAADARADGFAGLDEMLAVLGSIYPSARREGRRLYRVCFTFLPPDGPGPSCGEPSPPGRKPGRAGGGDSATTH